MAVCVPTHRHFPAGSGDSLMGTGILDSSSCDVMGTIGALKLTVRYGARATSPSGSSLVTTRGPGATRLWGAGAPALTGGGNASWIVSPGRGAGIDLARIAKSAVSSASAL